MITVGRLQLDDPESFSEVLGDPVGNLGAAPVPTDRTPISQSTALLTIAPTGQSDLLADRQRIRRQLRSLMNNTPLKLLGLYVAWDADTEQNGWYVPDRASLGDPLGAALAHGIFKLDGLNLLKVGARRTHRRAAQAYLRDRRLGTTPRDVLRQVYSTDFSGTNALAIHYLPANISTALNAVSGGVVALLSMGVARGGGTMYAATGLADLATVSFEQAEADRNLGDVVIYDRRGQITAPAGGPDWLWEEVYGPDYPVSSGDVPVLDNGLCRVRYDATNTPGFRVDVWTGAAYVEQGKILVQRRGDTTGFVDTLVSTAIVEWTPERAIVLAVFTRAADAYSYERVYLTLQRGWDGPRVEVYPAPKSAGTGAGARVQFSIAGADANNSVYKGDTAAANAATAGSGSSALPTAQLGAASFILENWIALTRPADYQVSMGVLQAGLAGWTVSDTLAYGATRNGIFVFADTSGYVSIQLDFAATLADMMMEAEAMTLGSGTSSVADGAASGGTTTQSTRTADAIHVSRATWPNSYNQGSAKYAIWVRAKTSASTLNLYAKTASTTTLTSTTTSTSYVWLRPGEVVANGTLEIHAWASAAATISVDRIEAHLIEDRLTAGSLDGTRDLGQAVLLDPRMIPAVVTR